MENVIKKKRGLSRNQKRLIFYTLMVAWPVMQTILFYVYVNFNTILLAFQRYDIAPSGLGYVVSFDSSFSSFHTAWNELIVDQLGYIGNGLKFYAIDFPVALILALSFSYYIYKKYPGHGLFKTMLFMPSLISGMVFCIIFKYIVYYGYMELMCMTNGLEVTYANMMSFESGTLLYNASTAVPTIIFYNIWISFGSNILLYSGGMSSIDESIVESCHLDGANVIQEMVHITLPLIFPTIISLVVVSLTGMFTNQLGLLGLYGDSMDGLSSETRRAVTTIGFRMYILSQKIGVNATNIDNLEYTTTHLSAYGLTISAFLIPIVLTIRKMLKKYGPSAD